LSPLEALAALLGLANILLIVRRSVWNFPFALAMVSLYALIFAEAKLYSDAGLQVFFFVVNLYGWWSWRANEADVGEVAVQRLGWLGRALWLSASLIAALLWGSFMHVTTDASFPWWDASIASGSVAAQILMTRRYIENWHGWIAVNLISLPLYALKGLWITCGLYAVFLGMAIWGLIEWRRALKVIQPTLQEVFN
jgi:nicotinamide mononucleotide transporter